ncbi:sensor histidine kinase [Rhodoferax sp.]|uniref:sensor histidine kinase n=1 Tax=Rhodoferax sp. TaxID=50421 RepID=UPI002ACDC6CE|nr:sensor histidine kinase N-terminal domain-containing protein [Rhodoferax sp.]MDZ7918443.1 sensor histidine kinase N-terminal domain-containing protein [Rhodoferax sp.]
MAPSPRTPLSLRRSLLLGILLPIVLFVVVDTISLYRQALGAVNTAYDRTLLASAKAIGELLDIEGDGPQARLRAQVPYSALEAFEADNRSRMSYRISDAKGQWIDGAEDLPAWRGSLPNQGPYAALVDFYDDSFRGDPVRVAVLLQPVATRRERTMAMVQVAETLELRRTLARQILIDTLQRQAILITVITAVVLIVVQRVTRPVRRMSSELQQRPEDDLTPLNASHLPLEIRPLTEATNQVMQRLQHLLDHQKRFVRDAAHQLRTPLAVLKVQVQSALRGDVAPTEALQEIQTTVDRATQLANQMLSLAKVEQVKQQQDFATMDWAEPLRAVALDVSALIADKDLDFDIRTEVSLVHAHEWMLREMARNLLHNAIRLSPRGGRLSVQLMPIDGMAELHIEDSGPGISDELRLRLFQPFAAGHAHSGSGLGLTITREMVKALGGSITLTNLYEQGLCVGLDACVRLPLQPQPD